MPVSTRKMLTSSICRAVIGYAPGRTEHRAMQSPLDSAGRIKQAFRIPYTCLTFFCLSCVAILYRAFSTHLLAAMAILLRQRLGALLARPPPLQISRDAVTKRFFAAKAHQHDDAEETYKWRSVTIAAYIMCISLGVYTFSNEEHNKDHSPAYSYLHIRNKEFPWGEDGLFEYKHPNNEEEH